jgi:hypothetical protein
LWSEIANFLTPKTLTNQTKRQQPEILKQIDIENGHTTTNNTTGDNTFFAKYGL